MTAVEYFKISHSYPASVCHAIMQVVLPKCVAADGLNECFFRSVLKVSSFKERLI